MEKIPKGTAHSHSALIHEFQTFSIFCSYKYYAVLGYSIVLGLYSPSFASILRAHLYCFKIYIFIFPYKQKHTYISITHTEAHTYATYIVHIIHRKSEAKYVRCIRSILNVYTYGWNMDGAHVDRYKWMCGTVVVVLRTYSIL